MMGNTTPKAAASLPAPITTLWCCWIGLVWVERSAWTGRRTVSCWAGRIVRVLTTSLSVMAHTKMICCTYR